MVPGSFGCGVIGLGRDGDVGAVARGRSAIASPMPREAPVMNSVLPLSDMADPFRRRYAAAPGNSYMVGGRTQGDSRPCS